MKWKQIIAFEEGMQRSGSLKARVCQGVAHFSLIGRIAPWSSEQQHALCEVIDDRLKAGVDNARVYLNSEGGCVFTACELAAMLGRFKTVRIQVGALVASAATYLTSRFHTTVRKNTQGMIHKPFTHFQGNVDDLQAELKLLSNITQDYVRTYAEKTGQSPEAVEALWSKGDYWMDAQEMKSQGFVDAIQGELKAFTRADVSALSACGAPFVPDLQSLEPKADKMDLSKEELIQLYGLEPTADKKAILAAAKKAQRDARAYAALKEEHTDPVVPVDPLAAAQALVDEALSAHKITADQRAAYLKLAQADWENTRLILQAGVAQKAKQTGAQRKEAVPGHTHEVDPLAAAQALVDGAISAHKITADKRAAYLKLAQADWESTRLILEAMVAVPQLSEQLYPSAAQNASGAQGNWSLEDYLEKDPKGYECMLEEQPEQAKRLEADYFSDPF